MQVLEIKNLSVIDLLSVLKLVPDILQHVLTLKRFNSEILQQGYFFDNFVAIFLEGKLDTSVLYFLKDLSLQALGELLHQPWLRFIVNILSHIALIVVECGLTVVKDLEDDSYHSLGCDFLYLLPEGLIYCLVEKLDQVGKNLLAGGDDCHVDPRALENNGQANFNQLLSV